MAQQVGHYVTLYGLGVAFDIDAVQKLYLQALQIGLRLWVEQQFVEQITHLRKQSAAVVAYGKHASYKGTLPYCGVCAAAIDLNKQSEFVYIKLV